MAILQSRTQTGMSWVKESVALFKLAPQKWLTLALAYVGIFMMLPSVPGLQFFAFISILLWPVFIAIAARLYRNAEIGKPENLATIIQLLQPKLFSLMGLGAACLLYGILVGLLLNSDIEGLAKISQGSKQISNAQMQALLQKMMPLLLKLSLLLVPLMMATWFSPMLIAFNNYSLVKAIKSSIAGSIQYMVALTAAWLLLASGIVVLMVGVGILMGIISAMLPAVAQLLMSFLVFGCLLLASALMLAFQYVSYRDAYRAVI